MNMAENTGKYEAYRHNGKHNHSKYRKTYDFQIWNKIVCIMAQNTGKHRTWRQNGMHNGSKYWKT